MNKKSFLFQEPVAEVMTHSLDDVMDAFEELERFRKEGFFLAGFVSYEAGFAFFPKIVPAPSQSALPLLHFGVFRDKIEITPKNVSPALSAALSDFSFDASREEYTQQQKKIREHLWAGNIYQLNQTFQMEFKSDLDSKALYDQLKQLQPTSYSAFLQCDGFEILSLSPELFYRKQGAKITTQPMKGTLPLGEDSRRLTEDEKTIAENLMIVDLLRNDLGRIAKPGTVAVENLFQVQSLSTVQQMTSTISAEVDRDLSLGQIFASLFPCGSITGAPKWSAMQEISKLEKSPRGVYTGAIGFIDPENNHCFNVAIRTLVCRNKKFSMGLGGGIVADSDVDLEYQEAHLKSRFLRQFNSSFGIFETMLFDGKRIKSLQDHIARLEKSALFYNFEFNRDLILQSLDKKIQNLEDEQKIKLKLFWDGQIEITTSALAELPIQRFVTLSPVIVNSQSHFQAHKTSCRKIYDEEWTRVQDLGYYDVLFLNEKEELVEASRHNLFLKINNSWFTPPLSSGALPGIERRHTIRQLSAQERVLTIVDLQSAQEILLTNSVRGQVFVQEVKL